MPGRRRPRAAPQRGRRPQRWSRPTPPLEGRSCTRGYQTASRLGSAIPVAQQHLRDNPPCQALFASLGADGVAKLDSSSYYPAGVKEERKYCRGSRVALARVGSPAVRLCRSFGRLSDQRAAIILIHEALHFAGQTEYPADSRAPDGTSITRMVMESCRLF